MTARLYEDLGLLTSKPKVGVAVSELFNYLTGYSRQTKYRSLLVAPHGLRKQLMALIRREAALASEGKPARIAMKVNGLADEAMISALYTASRAGVEIDLLVRGICSLVPGVEGLSETIRVRSVLGRFLEHSRIFYFHNDGESKFYIGSADLMPRNLDRRVEALVSVTDAELQERLKTILDLGFQADKHVWELDGHGEWLAVDRRAETKPRDMQEELMRGATADRA
jgi:polyphosphate kinase